MNNHNLVCDRVLALAGMLQVAFLVQQVARQGTISQDSAFRSSIESIFATDAATTKEVYGGVAGVELGLRLVRHHLGGTNETPITPSDRERIRYFFSLVPLERRLRGLPTVLDQIGTGIVSARHQADALGGTHRDVIAALAELYLETIATLGFRILVPGNQVYLTRPENANTIRALLLAGVRSAVLLHQRGGRRWMLLFHRRAFLDMVAQLLTSLPH